MFHNAVGISFVKVHARCVILWSLYSIDIQLMFAVNFTCVERKKQHVVKFS